jgi:4-amino-4-deoxy-L-arabinose transferase-like glycosyltransferase
LTKPKESILWLILLVLAALLRLGPIASGLPYSDYIDEGYNLQVAIRVLKSGKFDTNFSTYPPLTSHLVLAALKGYAPFYRILHHHKLSKDLPADRDFYTELGEQYDLITPPDVIWIGRLVIACLSIGTVIVAGALAKLIAGARAGFLAMLFTAVCPALVSRGSNVMVDPTATFFALAALYFCQRLSLFTLSNNPKKWRAAACAGIAAGLAFAAKYTVGAVFAAVLVTILTLPLAKISRAILISIAGAALFAGIFFGNPAMVLHFDKMVEWFHAITRFYQTIQSEQGYLAAALSAAEIGVPLMITGLAGIIWMSWNVTTRRVTLSWGAFALLLVSVVAWSNFQPFRNLLSLVPPLCIAAALFCDWLGQYFEQRHSRIALTSWLAPALILLVAGSLAFSSARHLHARTSHIDTRIRAIDWLREHATKDEAVLGIRELSILPAEWKRLAAKPTVIPWFQALDLLERQHFDYLVIGEFDLRYASDPKAWSAYSDRWKAKVSPLSVQADFGQVVTPVMPYLWRTTDERILIVKGNAP